MSFFENSLHNPPKHRAKIIIFALVLFAFFNLSGPQASISQGIYKNKTDCQCVVFRLDDIQDNFLNRSQLAVMNLFLEKNQSLTLALILNALGNDTTVLNKVRFGYELGNFELASHGWNHENFSKLNEQDQVDLLRKANEKMHRIFGVYSTIFIPPLYEFNNSTLDAARQVGINVFSSLDKYYEHRNQSGLITHGIHSDPVHGENILHFPTTLQYSYFDGARWNTYSVQQSLQSIHESISSYGYAVVTLHPQGFVNLLNNNLTNSVNSTQIKNLAEIIDSINSENIHTTSFYKLGGINNKSMGEANNLSTDTNHKMVPNQ